MPAPIPLRHHHTIAAIATAPGGGIGVVRLSGSRAEAIVAQLVKPWPKGRAPSHKLSLGWVHDPRTGEPIDEVLAVIMRAPRSYTGEDVAELQGHGGAVVLERVLDAVLALGARRAEPGEFTRRAFESGRIDLTRAEAVADLVAARSDHAARAARALLSGALAREVEAARREVVRVLAELEGAIDFPDDSADAASDAECGHALGEVAEGCRRLATTFRPALFDRLTLALAGRVNAGKSSLFNALLGEERALVDAQAGTTRDLLEAEVDLGGAVARLCDLAGERWEEAVGSEAGGEPSTVERRGIALGRRWRDRADGVLLVVDGAAGFGAGERALWDALGERPRLIVWNKSDLAPAPVGLPDGARVVATSARTGDGIDALRQAMRHLAGGTEPEGALAVSGRQRDALDDAALALEEAASRLCGSAPTELGAEAARRGLHHLGQITGETLDPEVLDAIFRRFCIGK